MKEGITYEVWTNLNPEELTEVAKETYRMWLEFALGNPSSIGRRLMHPTGRYASSLQWKKIGVAQVAIIADEDIAPEAGIIETGTTGANMKKMLDRFGVRYNKEGRKYRFIPMRGEGPRTPLSGITAADIVPNQAGIGEHLSGRVKRIWGQARRPVDMRGATKSMSQGPRWRTMTEDSPPSWQIAPMPMMAPGSILATMLRDQYGAR